jgi:glutathione-independent formaldehyde dehydrogenase
MKALVYHGPKKVSVDTVPDAKLEKYTDVVIKLTTTNICGSDLHMYEGRTDVEKGKILGHENLGEVVDVGKAVDTVHKGDRVVLPFNIGCGFCNNCERGLTGFCLTCAACLPYTLLYRECVSLCQELLILTHFDYPETGIGHF